jgi:hypothetical protein
MDETMLDATIATTTDANPAPRLDTKAWLAERIDGKIALGVGVSWLVLFQIAGAL